MHIQIRFTHFADIQDSTSVSCHYSFIHLFILVRALFSFDAEKMNYLALTPTKPCRVESPSLVFCVLHFGVASLPSFPLSEKFSRGPPGSEFSGCVSARRLELSKRVTRGRRRPAALTAIASRLSAAEEKMTKLSVTAALHGQGCTSHQSLRSGGG